MDLSQVSAVLGFVFTLLIFSYLLGDNVLYRLSISVFVGLGRAALLDVEDGGVAFYSG